MGGVPPPKRSILPQKGGFWPQKPKVAGKSRKPPPKGVFFKGGGFGPLFSKVAGKSKGVRFLTPQRGGVPPPKGGGYPQKGGGYPNFGGYPPKMDVPDPNFVVFTHNEVVPWTSIQFGHSEWIFNKNYVRLIKFLIITHVFWKNECVYNEKWPKWVIKNRFWTKMSVFWTKNDQNFGHKTHFFQNFTCILNRNSIKKMIEMHVCFLKKKLIFLNKKMVF